ncbi:serine hydrolase [Pedobacter sp. UBA4863]|uniref:serine hydrolase domain-containing protein n=1 Tax=Pedobacter sp. UBA4863 TaxID=1947060 RepID=UPI0025F2A3F7|nr:serine hydrolase domain-containing protein [Pedobacter sp. UBA4863]
MIRKNLIIFSLTVLITPIYAQQNLDSRAKAYIDSALKKYDDTVPGAVVHVIHKGSLVYQKAFGLADLELGVKLKENSVFEAASVSKQFTATAVLMLVEQGKIKIEDDIRKYIPELPDYGKPITIAQLLTHTSGLRDWRNVGYVTDLVNQSFVYGDGDALNVIFRQKGLNFPSGTKYSYSNSNYDLLALLVERVSGEKFIDFSTRTMLKPLGMTNSTWRTDYRKVIKNRAKSYMGVKGNFITQMPLDNTNGAAGLLTTTEDLQKWIAWWKDGKFGPTLAKLRLQHYVLTNGTETSYALGGVHFYSKPGSKLITHGGLLAGYRAITSYYPDIDLSVTFLSNTRELIIPKVADQLLEIYSGVKPLKTDSTKLKYVKLSPQEVQQKVGLYKNTLGVRTVELVIVDGKLRVKNGGELKALNKNTLVTGDDKYQFQGNNLLLPDEEALVTYKKVETLTPDSTLLNKLTGLYYSADADTKITLTVYKNSLRYTRNGYKYIYLRPSYKDGNIVGFSGLDNGLMVMFDFDTTRGDLQVSMPRALGIAFVKNK